MGHKQFEPDVVPDSQCTIHSAYAIPNTYEEGSVPSNIYEYFSAVENGQFPFFNNTSTHISAMRNAMGETLLITAARLGHADIVELLLNAEIDIEETDNDGWNALLCAAYGGFARVVNILLVKGASIEQPDLMGWTPMLWACYKNRVEVVDVLISKHAHINVVGEEDGLTPLLIASGRGYLEIVTKLIAAGAQVNASDKFGNTALIWAARKGFQRIVEELLSAGAEVDAVGMQSSTALMLATRGNYTRVVDILLSREPNVNIVDYNGLSALSIAAREGYADIAQALIQSGAFVNTIDRFGNSILANAVRSGNIQIVRLLLEKHADVNAKDSEGRTPLHLAIDKAYTDIVIALLEKRPNLELKNKEGDTALIRAVKNRDRDIGIVQFLVNMGAKISATDNFGDNSLHLALRARSKKLTQILLVNPGDSKLLYRPNKEGETPYSIDQESNAPILPSIFGSIDADSEIKSLTGYNVYSDVLADILCEPNLSLPLTIGLYSKWGSGKSFLLPKIRDSMRAFSRTWLEGIELYWSWTIFILLVAFCSLLSLTASVIFTIATNFPNFGFSMAIGVVICVSCLLLYAFVYYGSEVKLWNSSIQSARLIARWLARFKLILSVLTLNTPIRTDKELIVSPVSFLFADDHKISFIGGEQTLANIVKSLFQAVEDHFGTFSVRLFLSLRQSSNSSKFQTLCGIPLVMFILGMVISFVLSLLFLIDNIPTIKMMMEGESSVDKSKLLPMIIFFSLFICFLTTIFYSIGVKLLINSPKRRINKLIHNLHTMPFERMVQKLQREVDLLVETVKSLDAFTNGQTRLVVMVDGLDSCEQNKMIQLLDALSLFFCSRQSQQPFIVILAIDPHIIVSSIQQNLKMFSVSPTEITGSDYINNIVTMPFYLDQTSLIKKIQKSKQRQPTSQLQSNSSNNLFLRDRRRSETLKGSRLSLRDQKDGAGSNSIAPTNELGHLFPSYDFFTSINPRTMRRIVNSIALTGRLLRIFEVSFTWSQLYSWISLIEQWPLRMAWLIDIACSHQDDYLPLIELYSQIKHKIMVNDGLANFDRNCQDFENVLRKMGGTNRGDQLTIAHVRAFSMCTSNLDPNLRKLVREQRGAKTEEIEQDESEEKADQMAILKEIVGNAEFLFDDMSVWTGISKPLQRMSKDEVIVLVRKLCIPQNRLQNIVQMFQNHNLTGMVLYSCDLKELKEVLKLPLGDWVMIQMLIETLRRWKPFPSPINPTSVGRDPPNNPHKNSTVTAHLQNLHSIEEEEQVAATPQSQKERVGSGTLLQESVVPDVINNEKEDDDYKDCDDGDSDASTAGSEHSLIKSSVSREISSNNKMVY